MEYIADKRRIGAKTLFATHYHELTELEESLPGVKNYNIAAIKRKDDITFLRRIVRGGADESYGIEVAKLAGVPDLVFAEQKKFASIGRRTASRSKTKTKKATVFSGRNRADVLCFPTGTADYG